MKKIAREKTEVNHILLLLLVLSVLEDDDSDDLNLTLHADDDDDGANDVHGGHRVNAAAAAVENVYYAQILFRSL